MTYSEQSTRAYARKHLQHASEAEREKLVQDWLTKDVQAEGIANDFERRVRPLAGLRVLDAGSGNGGISIAFARHGAHIDGVEIEEELVAIARTEAIVQHSNANFILYDGTTLPFADCSFDAAISVSVIEHVTDPVRYLYEILRVLKPSGFLYLAFPNRLHPKETHTGLWGLSYLPRPLGGLYAKWMKRNRLEDLNLHFYSYWSMRRILSTAAIGGRALVIQEEKGNSTNTFKIFVKNILHAVGIPHQALLPHVMLILRVS